MDEYTIRVRSGPRLGTFRVWYDDVEIHDVTEVTVDLAAGQYPMVRLVVMAVVDGEFETRGLTTFAPTLPARPEPKPSLISIIQGL